MLKKSNILTYGNLNPNLIFLVIKQESQGRGLFSLLSSTICWIDFAKRNDLIPVVDFENFKTEYNESEKVNNTFNAFEYYFNPLNNYSLNEVYKSKNVVLSGNSFPENYNYDIAENIELASIFKKYFVLNKELLDSITKIKKEFPYPKILGVHYRGKEMRFTGGHRYPPTFKQMIFSINHMLTLSIFDKIFVSSEDPSLITKLEKTYPGMIIYNKNYYRSKHGNAYKETPRRLHRYKLGKEVLTDMLFLSECDSFISGSSNVSSFAYFVNNGNYKNSIIIKNPINFRRFKMYSFSWYIKSVLPPFLLGFKTDRKTIIVK